jgi:hypothetical protein
MFSVIATGPAERTDSFRGNMVQSQACGSGISELPNRRRLFRDFRHLRPKGRRTEDLP